MTIRFGWPQLIYVVLTLAGLMSATVNHGKPRSPENAWTSLFATVVVIALLYWGGFFS